MSGTDSNVFACDHGDAARDFLLVTADPPPSALPACPTCGQRPKHVGHATARAMIDRRREVSSAAQLHVDAVLVKPARLWRGARGKSSGKHTREQFYARFRAFGGVEVGVLPISRELRDRLAAAGVPVFRVETGVRG